MADAGGARHRERQCSRGRTIDLLSDAEDLSQSKGVSVEGLLRRLSSDGSEAENALRVVAFFDRLVEARGGIDELVRSSARLIGAPTGYRSETSARAAAFNERGRGILDDPPATAVIKKVRNDSTVFGWVWIDGSSENTFLTELVAERMAMAASSILSRSAIANASSESNPLSVLLNAETATEDRVVAARHLGFRADWTVRVLVIRTSRSLTDTSLEVRLWAAERRLTVTTPQFDDGLAVSLVHDGGLGPVGVDAPFKSLAALGARSTVTNAADSLITARQALQLTSTTLGPRFVDHEALGALTHLASLTPEQATSTDLVRRFVFIAGSESGRAELLALDAFCRHRSLRLASAELNLHHSSLSNRLKNIEKRLELDLGSPDILFRIALSLQLYRIAVSGQ